MCKRTAFGVVLSLALSAVGCGKGHVEASAEGTAAAEAPAAAPAATADPMTPESTIVEEGELGTITWNIQSDGRVEALVKRPDGTPVTRDVTGIVTWPGEAADDQEELKPGAEGHLFASGPALEQDLTEIDYDLAIEGKPWSGVLHVPRGGTRELAAEVKADSGDTKVAVPAGKRGPNGGVIQIIGGEPVEVVADSVTGEMRVYFLGPDLEVIDPGERRVRLGYVADVAENVELVREPGGLYFVAGVRTRVDPARITLAWGLGASAAMHVGIVGFHFGARLGVGVRAPAVPVFHARTWTPSVGVRVGTRVDVRVHQRVEVGGRVDVRERVKVKVHGHDRDHDHGRGHDHDRGLARGHGRDHDRGGQGGHVKVHGGDHGGGHRPSHGGGHGQPSRGGGGKGKRR